MYISIDEENGGYFTCLDGDGNLYDDTKFMWLNGRQVYMLARMYTDCGDCVDTTTRESWIRDTLLYSTKVQMKICFSC